METKSVEQVRTQKIAIVGMDAFFGSAKELDAFERSVYDGIQHFIPVPPQRWQGREKQEQLLKEYGFEGVEVPLGAYIESFEIDTLRFKISDTEAEELSPQQLLLLKVVDRALKDAGLKEGRSVAVIIAAGTEISVHQIQSCISDLWNFTIPSCTLTTGENSTYKALDVAQRLLAAKEVDAVLVAAVDLAGGLENVLLRNQAAKINTGINTLSYDQNAKGWMVGEGAGAVVLKLHETAKQDRDCIYAVMESITLVQKPSSVEALDRNSPSSDSAAITQACQQAFEMADVKPQDVGYLEVTGSGVQQEDELEIEGLIQAYRASEPELTCAIGSVKTNIGHTYTASGMATLIKTALCLYHRYIPGTPQWSAPKTPEAWKGSPFYVATESRPWLLEGATRRLAAINGTGSDEIYAHLILSEAVSQEESSQKDTLNLPQRDRPDKYLQQMPYYLFPIAADNSSDLIDQLKTLQQNIENCASLSTAASLTFEAFQKHREATYALAILGRNRDELAREIQRAFQGVANAFQRGEDWKTPAGSYFTTKPLGKEGKIAYVYPGAFGAYVGMGQNICRLFPQVFDHPIIRSVETSLGRIGKLLFPRSLNKLKTRQLEALEQRLLDDVAARLESEVGYATLMTTVTKDYFKIHPHCTFGYSLGETSMMCAQGIWSNFNQGSNSLNSSTLFETQLSGPKNAVRKHWGLAPQPEDGEPEFWSTHVLMAPVFEVKECLKQENRVYLTQINTPKEVVIAGDTQACQRVISRLSCHSITPPLDYAIHCEAIRSEYDELKKLNTLPIQSLPDTIVYSAAEYAPLAIDSQTIGHSMAQVLCQQFDFPRLVNRVYEDGIRIFIEAGSGSMCSRWIGEILKQEEHLTVAFNRRGIDDHTSVIKALATLFSHRVSLDLSPLYANEKETSSQTKSIVKTITLGGQPLTSTIVSKTNKKEEKNMVSQVLPISPNYQQLVQDLKKSGKLVYPNGESTMNNGKSAMNGSKNLSNKSLASGAKQEDFQEKSITNNSFIAPQNTQYYADSFVSQPGQNNLNTPQYQKLSENAALVTKTHAAFLQARQQSLQQISEIIKLQIAVSQQLLNQKSLDEN